MIVENGNYERDNRKVQQTKVKYDEIPHTS